MSGDAARLRRMAALVAIVTADGRRRNWVRSVNDAPRMAADIFVWDEAASVNDLASAFAV